MTSSSSSPSPPTARATASNREPACKQRLRLWLAMLRSTRAVEAELRKRMRVTFNRTLPQFDVLAVLARNGGTATMTKLSRALMVSNGNVTGIIDRLVSEGLVSRAATANDRRTVMISLTREGAASFEVMAGTHQAWINELLFDVNNAEASQMTDRLKRLARRTRQGGDGR